MVSHSGIRRAIVTGERFMPSLREVVSNIVGVWSLHGLPQGDWEKDWLRQLSGILPSAILFRLHFFFICTTSCFVLEEGNRWLLLYPPNGEEQSSSASPDPQNLSIQLLAPLSSGSHWYVCSPEIHQEIQGKMWHHHFRKLDWIRKYPLFHPLYLVLSCFWMVVVVSQFSQIIPGFLTSLCKN